MMTVDILNQDFRKQILTDNYPTETSWQLIDGNGTVVQSISPNGNLTNANTNLNMEFFSTNDGVKSCYSFGIHLNI